MSKYIDELTELICDTVRTVFPNASLDDGYDVADEVIAKLPTIEVSEDCISRKWLLDKAECGFDKLGEDYDINHMLRDIKDAPPSAASTTEQSCDTCKYRELYECSDCRFASKWERIEE